MLRPARALVPLLPLVLASCVDAGVASTEGGSTAAAMDSTSVESTTDVPSTGEPSTGESVPVASLEGDAFPFSWANDGIPGATITLLEEPARSVVTDPDGHFRVDELPVGSEISLRMSAAGYPPIQTGTFTIPLEGITRATFQAPQQEIYDLLASIVMITPDPQTCQLVTTVTRIGKSLYDEGAHGEAGVTVQLDPPLPPAHGPVYFNADVVPDLALTETSDDGGVLYTNVPPGEYTLVGTKAGATFTAVHFKCEAGWLVNASPPWGLQRLQ
jgi:hypothetical protein